MDKRTHTCGALRTEHAQQQVVLMGWVRTLRDHGGIVFLDLWDREGTTQIVVDPQDSQAAYGVAQGLHPEYVVAVRGTVKVRPADAVNHHLATGKVELVAEKIKVLNTARPLPFPLEENGRQDELGLRYRYLDLRRDRALANLRLRHEVVKSLRATLDYEGFLEIETPILGASTPEGARDYLVPSRVHPGNFYALPQSPQQLKQLLMVAGVDKYYQIARCFRDEDLRADRQPEFTQLDLEMSFVVQEDILNLVEMAVVQAVRETAPHLRIPSPFPRMSYDQVMATYGSDKPDIRYDLAFVDLSEVFASSGLRIFQQVLSDGGWIKGIKVPGREGKTVINNGALDRLKILATDAGAGGLIWVPVEANGLRGPIVKHLSKDEKLALCEVFEAEVGDLLLVVAGAPETVAEALGVLRREMAQQFGLADPETLAFAWVLDFPMFKYDTTTHGWEAEHHPFTSPKTADLPGMETDPGAVRADCFDLVCNGWELGSGSIRIHQRDIQQRVFEILGYNEEDAQERFGHLLEAFTYGAPPHGGFAVGIDRLVAILAGTDTIRDVIAFPKTGSAKDLMMQAPAGVSTAQLDEVHIGIQSKSQSKLEEKETKYVQESEV